MPAKKGITLRDVLAHIQGFRTSVEQRLDRVENRLTRVEQKLGNVENRLGSVENRLEGLEISLAPSHKRLQMTVLAHGGRITKLERKYEKLVVV